MNKKLVRVIKTDDYYSLNYDLVDEKDEERIYGHINEIWYSEDMMKKMKTEKEIFEIDKNRVVNRLTK